MLAAGGKPVKDSLANSYSFAAVHSLGARDGLEALLAMQMVGVHSLAVKFLATAAMEEQTAADIELFTGRADRLLRTFATQVETLKKYRSKGEQHCTVEHVHVHRGRPVTGPSQRSISIEWCCQSNQPQNASKLRSCGQVSSLVSQLANCSTKISSHRSRKNS